MKKLFKKVVCDQVISRQVPQLLDESNIVSEPSTSPESDGLRQRKSSHCSFEELPPPKPKRPVHCDKFPLHPPKETDKVGRKQDLQTASAKSLNVAPQGISATSEKRSIVSKPSGRTEKKQPQENRLALRTSKSKVSSFGTAYSSFGHLKGELDDFENDGLHEGLLADLESQGPTAVAAFGKALAEGKQQMRSVKLCFVGQARAGKTSTLLALAGREFNPAQPSTHGVETCALTHELLKASCTGSSPWGKLEDGAGSVANLLERGVAQNVALHLKCRTDEAEELDFKEDDVGLRTRSAHAHGLNVVSSSFGWNPKPEMLKMPVDLIAQAVSGDMEDYNQPVVMQTWDFAGQEMYYSMAHVFLTSLGIYLLVIDMTAWLATLDETSSGNSSRESADATEFWLASILMHAPDARLVVVGTHDDSIPMEQRSLVHSRANEYLAKRLEVMPSLHSQLCVNELEQLLFYPVDNSRTSSEGQQTVDRLREVLNRLAVEACEEMGSIPSSWAHFFHVLREEGTDVAVRPCVSFEECKEIAAPFGLGSIEALEPCLRLFHRLGQLFYFPGSPAVVLDPQWLLDAMAQVVACPRVLERLSHRTRALRERGELSSELLAVLWAQKRFQAWKSTLETFLEHFDLIVPDVSSKNGEVRWLVPSMLPKRCGALLPSAAIKTGKHDAVLILDFHGALRMLLPSMLLRLLCHLRHGRSDLRTFQVCQDFAIFSIGGNPLIITLEMLPLRAPEVMRVGIDCLPTNGSGKAVKSLLDAISEALLSWMPRLSFSVKLPCPLCSGVADSKELCDELCCHLLDIDELADGQVTPLCPYELAPIETALPAFVQAWRQGEWGASHVGSNPPKDNRVERDRADEDCVVMTYLYASPLAWRMKPLDELNISLEFQMLQGLSGLSMQIHVATVDALREALLAMPTTTQVVHISAHCVSWPRPALLLEDEISQAQELTEDDLVAMGTWNRKTLILVFLGCGSELLVRSLIRRCGLCCAICCAGEVFDAASRLFCRGFYHALGSGYSVESCFQLAQGALRTSSNAGLHSEADKFLFLRATEEVKVEMSSLAASAPRECCPRWSLWPQVEDYTGRVIDSLRAAQCFQRRRVLLVTGLSGVGKSAFCREFCRHYSAPGGRLFSAGTFWLSRDCLGVEAEETSQRAFMERFAVALLEEIGSRNVALVGCRALTHVADSPLTALRSAIAKLDEAGRWLLVIDGLQVLSGNAEAEEESRLAETLEALLGSCARLCVLLTSPRQPRGARWCTLAGAKVNLLELAPLPPLLAAGLFAKRLRRPLYLSDFDSTAQVHSGAPLQMGRGDSCGLLERLAASPLLHILGNLPARIVEAAAGVDESLPSLLQHPLLPSSWKAHIEVGSLDSLEGITLSDG